MQIPVSTLEKFFRVPAPIDVSVDADGWGGYVAQVMPTISSTDLGVEVAVKIFEFELEDEDYPFTSGSEEMFCDLLTRVRDAFANLMLLGTLNVGYGGMYGLDKEDAKNFNAAMDSLPEGFFDIDLEKAIAARQEMLKKDQQVVGGVQAILDVMNQEAMRRGYTKEQREKMTIGDAFGLDDPKE